MEWRFCQRALVAEHDTGGGGNGVADFAFVRRKIMPPAFLQLSGIPICLAAGGIRAEAGLAMLRLAIGGKTAQGVSTRGDRLRLQRSRRKAGRHFCCDHMHQVFFQIHRQQLAAFVVQQADLQRRQIFFRSFRSVMHGFAGAA